MGQKCGISPSPPGSALDPPVGQLDKRPRDAQRAAGRQSISVHPPPPNISQARQGFTSSGLSGRHSLSRVPRSPVTHARPRGLHKRCADTEERHGRAGWPRGDADGANGAPQSPVRPAATDLCTLARSACRSVGRQPHRTNVCQSHGCLPRIRQALIHAPIPFTSCVKRESASTTTSTSSVGPLICLSINILTRLEGEWGKHGNFIKLLKV